MATLTDPRPPAPYPALHTVRYSALDYVALVLLIIGGLNWGLVGLLQFDLVAAVLGRNTMPSRVVYVLVGIAALYCITLLFRKPKL